MDCLLDFERCNFEFCTGADGLHTWSWSDIEWLWQLKKIRTIEIMYDYTLHTKLNVSSITSISYLPWRHLPLHDLMRLNLLSNNSNISKKCLGARLIEKTKNWGGSVWSSVQYAPQSIANAMFGSIITSAPTKHVVSPNGSRIICFTWKPLKIIYLLGEYEGEMNVHVHWQMERTQDSLKRKIVSGVTPHHQQHRPALAPNPHPPTTNPKPHWACIDYKRITNIANGCRVSERDEKKTHLNQKTLQLNEI